MTESPTRGSRSGGTEDTEFRVLGPMQANTGGHRHGLGGPKQRAVLALLIARAGGAVTTDVLIEGLYGEDAFERAHRSLHTFVSNLRTELGEVIERAGDGYALTVDRRAIDAVRFEEALAEAERSGSPTRALSVLRSALLLWRGEPYADVDLHGSLAAERTRLNELRVAAIGRRIEAELAEGRHAIVIGELEALTSTYPLRETFWAQLMLALYRSGRQAEALRSYEKARRYLVRAVGLDPSPGLQELERRILDHDPALLDTTRDANAQFP